MLSVHSFSREDAGQWYFMLAYVAVSVFYCKSCFFCDIDDRRDSRAV